MDEIINDHEKNSVLSVRESLNAHVNNWLNDITSEYDDFKQLINQYGYEDVLCLMAAEHWGDTNFIASKIQEAKDFFRHIKRPADKKLTIALYHSKIAEGGAERVTALLSTILSNIKGADGNAKYRFVLITDEPKLENEYPLNGPIIREFLPDWHECLKEDYRSRFQAWQHIIEKWDVDAVIYAFWAAPPRLWDMLAVKGQANKPAFVLQLHNFTMIPYLWDSDYAPSYYYGLCDAAVTLSECDKRFVELFCPNVRYIPNPIAYLTGNSASEAKEEHAIVWTGRLAATKQPMDMVLMMERVVKKVPDAKLYLVGNGEEKLTKSLKDKAAELGLEKNIVFTGFVTDVASYYQRGSIYVCTSQYEGFPMSIGEALSFSLPVVMYDLPWLSCIKDGRGIKTVPMGRYDLLAKSVIQLFENPSELKKIGQEARALIEDMSAFDIAGAWQDVIEKIDPDKTPERAASDERILFEHLSIYQDRVKKRLRQLKQKSTSTSYKILNFVTARIDIKNSAAPENDVEILDISDADAKIKSPDWMRKNGNGRVIKSEKGALSFKLKCTGSGKLSIKLKGNDVRNADGKRIPVWVQYSKLEVDGKVIFDSLTPAWHDRPFTFTLDVSDGQILEVKAEWTPDCAVIGAGAESCRKAQEKTLKSAKAEAEKARNSANTLNAQLAASNAAKDELERQLADIRSGLSFKLGRLITYIPRKILGRN